MEKVTVWTKQSEEILKNLEETGRHTAKREYIGADLDEYAPLVQETYDWLANNTPVTDKKPHDAKYPVWVSLARERTMLLTEGYVILELSIDKDILTLINIDKWSSILNYSYLPQDKEDAKEHRAMLELYGVSDTEAYMSQFYPHIKRKIIKSWSRLFDSSVVLSNENCFGNIWEIRKEWITNIIR